MAVPFVLPDDSDEETTLEQNALAGICALLRMLQEINARRPRTPQITARVRTNGRRVRDEQIRETVASLLDLSTTNTRTDAETVCWDDHKDVVVTAEEEGEDWNQQQVGAEIRGSCICKIVVTLHQEAKTSRHCRCRFSNLVPPLLSGSIWTAMICAVGWHLLRTR